MKAQVLRGPLVRDLDGPVSLLLHINVVKLVELRHYMQRVVLDQLLSSLHFCFDFSRQGFLEKTVLFCSLFFSLLRSLYFGFLLKNTLLFALLPACVNVIPEFFQFLV